jgi:hypothetical protein
MMMPEVGFIIGKQHQIVRVIVKPILVNVMHNFLWTQKPAQLSLHYQAMFKHPAIGLGLSLVARRWWHNSISLLPRLRLMAVYPADIPHSRTCSTLCPGCRVMIAKPATYLFGQHGQIERYNNSPAIPADTGQVY